MRIDNNYYSLFYKDRNRWVGPIDGEMWRLEDLIADYGSLKECIKEYSKDKHKKVKIFKEIWEEI